MRPLYPIKSLTMIATLLFCTACSNEVAIPTTQTPASVATAHATTLTDLSAGQKIYEKDCGYCHTTGTLNAPVLGRKRAWDKPTQEGLEHLVDNVILGIGEMEPKGGAHKLTDAEIKLAVAYIVKKSN